jgi:hypothetical protein
MLTTILADTIRILEARGQPADRLTLALALHHLDVATFRRDGVSLTGVSYIKTAFGIEPDGLTAALCGLVADGRLRRETRGGGERTLATYRATADDATEPPPGLDAVLELIARTGLWPLARRACRSLAWAHGGFGDPVPYHWFLDPGVAAPYQCFLVSDIREPTDAEIAPALATLPADPDTTDPDSPLADEIQQPECTVRLDPQAESQLPALLDADPRIRGLWKEFAAYLEHYPLFGRDVGPDGLQGSTIDTNLTDSAVNRLTVLYRPYIATRTVVVLGLRGA